MQKTHKHSKKRDAIWQYLSATKDHPATEWVYKELKPQLPDLSLGTVYRNIRMFQEEGAIVSLGVVNGLERFDADVTPHAHFICQHCGAVADLPSVSIPEALLEAAEAEASGQVSGCSLQFVGRCRKCLSPDCDDSRVSAKINI